VHNTLKGTRKTSLPGEAGGVSSGRTGEASCRSVPPRGESVRALVGLGPQASRPGVAAPGLAGVGGGCRGIAVRPGWRGGRVGFTLRNGAC
jgi:hypothetical protein